MSPSARKNPSLPDSGVVTLELIARESDCSIQTVSRVLRGKNKEIWPGMAIRADRIRAVAQRLGYKPNAAARSMRSNRFSSIGYFVATPEGEGVSHQEDQVGVCHGANQHEYHVSLIHLPIATVDANLSSIPRALQEACIDALIVANFMALPTAIKASIRASRLPVVYLNGSDPVNAVKIDDLQGARTMTRHLIEQGFRDIAFLEIKTTHSLPNHYSFLERQTGYSATMREAGLKERIVSCENADYLTTIRNLLLSKNRPDAIFCREDLVAMMVQRVALQEGIAIPGDLALAGYNDDITAKYSPVRLTSMAVPFFEMGVAAAEMAIALCKKGGRDSLPSAVFVPRLVVRESTKKSTGLSSD